MLRPLDATGDRAWAHSFLVANLGDPIQARRGALVDVLAGCEGLVGDLDGRPSGLITWATETGGRDAEIRAVAVDVAARRRGLGRALFEGAHEALAAAGVRSAWLVTTNDNAPAIHLYESLGYVISEIRRGAIDELRRTVKPSIPRIGQGGIEMRDELEMRRSLAGG